MIFSSVTFFVFLAVLAGLFAALRGDLARRRLLLVASYVFYGWWDPRFLLLMLGSSLWSWYWGNRVAATDDPKARRRRVWCGVAGDLGVLAYFKYANFFLDSFRDLFGITGHSHWDIVLPVGISFFTFQTMSYTIDVYRRRIDVCHDFERFALFVAFFPQLVAGPIVRAADFLPQLYRRVATTRDDVVVGLQLFLLGLVQKVVVADNLARYVDPVFADPALYDAATLWGGLAGYGLQIFCDFAGYSLMAIGIARAFGFHLPKNFDTPYLATSITDFWRRWHISLSGWLRDYLYISLGGNRGGPVRTDVNLFLTMLLGGLWHGAGWNFVLWGAAHGVGLLVHKRWARWLGDRGGVGRAVFGWALTLTFVLLLWVPFRCVDFATTQVYLARLFTAGDGIHWVHTPSLLLMAGMAVWHALHLRPNALLSALPSTDLSRWRTVWAVGALIVVAVMWAPFEASPFIYFQF